MRVVGVIPFRYQARADAVVGNLLWVVILGHRKYREWIPAVKLTGQFVDIPFIGPTQHINCEA